jgi:triosephosphate isomerase
MSKPILIANWKNHPESLKQANIILKGLSSSRDLYKKLQTYIAPPFPYFESVQREIKGYAGLASQDLFFAMEGTYTGAVTQDILKNAGVKLSIIGHSERRALGETNEVVAEKVKCALRSGITPVICIGEEARDPEGNHFEFIREEIRLSLEGVRRKDDVHKLIIAYEPVWAIGKKAKDAIKPEDLGEMTLFIKKVLTDIFNRQSAEMVPILYGGSVKPENASVIAGSGVDGFLVGGASLDVRSFKIIAESLLSK